jgi:hypothetical protein
MYGDDSDEELYDKTKKKSKKAEKAETHDELVIKQKEAEQKIIKLEAEISEKKKLEAENKKKQQQEEEDLDAFMQTLSKKPLQDNKSMFVLVKELNQLKKVKKKLHVFIITITNTKS